MPVTLMGIKLKSLSISVTDAVPSVSGEYQLVSSAGKVLATQSFNGYQDMKIEMTKETKQLLDGFMAAYANEINGTIGLGDSQ